MELNRLRELKHEVEIKIQDLLNGFSHEINQDILVNVEKSDNQKWNGIYDHICEIKVII